MSIALKDLKKQKYRIFSPKKWKELEKKFMEEGCYCMSCTDILNILREAGTK
jgi:hypothetical protein